MIKWEKRKVSTGIHQNTFIGKVLIPFVLQLISIKDKIK
jgi:hypothetical protein